MSKIATGGPAFPGNESYIDGYPASREGMTLRDWYAGQALIGLLASGQWNDATIKSGCNFADYVAEQAGEIADAMVSMSAKAGEANAKAREEEFGNYVPF